jgi:hypothetical protein
MMFRIDSRTGTADYSLAKKNYPVLSELKYNQQAQGKPLFKGSIAF